MTNEEKIRQMTTKELAGLIACGSTVFSCKDCKYHRIGTCKDDCKKAIIEWLGEEAEKDWYLIRRERLLEIKEEGIHMNEKQSEEIMRQVLQLEKELKTIKNRTERSIPVVRDRQGRLAEELTLKDWLQKLNEEVDEVKYDVMEVYSLQEIPGGDADYLPNGIKKNIAVEICDVIKVLYSMASQMGIDGDFLDKAMHACNEKTRRRGCHE